MKRLFILAIIAAMAVGCTDSVRGRIGSLGAKHRIEMYSGGKLVRKWVSTGKPENEANSDGYYFVDSESKELVRVSADVVITQLD